MGISEIIAAISAVGISSFILALVKLLAFFKDANKEKVTDILTRVDDDNKRWYNRYREAQDDLIKEQRKSSDLRILAERYRIELLTSGVPESRLEDIEKETDNGD